MTINVFYHLKTNKNSKKKERKREKVTEKKENVNTFPSVYLQS